MQKPPLVGDMSSLRYSHVSSTAPYLAYLMVWDSTWLKHIKHRFGLPTRKNSKTSFSFSIVDQYTHEDLALEGNESQATPVPNIRASDLNDKKRNTSVKLSFLTIWRKYIVQIFNQTKWLISFGKQISLHT